MTEVIAAVGEWLMHGRWVAPSIAVGSAAIAWRSYRHVRRIGRRDALKLAADLHRDMTTGSVADARHVIGTSIYGSSEAKAAVRSQVMESYYVLLWAFERLATGVEVLVESENSEALAILRTAIDWHVAEVGKNILSLHNGDDVVAKDAQAIARFNECVHTLKASGIDARIALDDR